MKPKRTSLAIGTLALSLSLGGCIATESGNQNTAECSAPTVEDRTVTLKEETPLALTGQDVLDRIVGSYSTSLDWSDPTWVDTNVTFTVALDGAQPVRYLNEVHEIQTPQPCGLDKEVLVMPLEFTLSTDDGRLDERWSDTIEVSSIETSEWVFPMFYVYVSELGGSLSLTEHDRVTIHTALSGGEQATATGRVEGFEPVPEQACSEDSCPGYRPITANIATW